MIWLSSYYYLICYPYPKNLSQLSLIISIINLLMAKQLVMLTSNCIRQILTRSKKDEMLRIMVDSGGCNGFSYNYSFDNQQYGDDTVIEQQGARVVVDNISANFITGSIIDYRDEMIRAGFVIETNPNADTACSCQMSFSPKNQ
jgi:iron-sulfur cluster assembly 2